jgi:hypothetical protein
MSRQPKAQSFDQFVESAGRPTKPQAWEGWPSVAKAEVAKVLELNDAGQAQVSTEAMVRRLTEVHGCRASIDIVKRYARVVLGRTSWKVP